jgi:hypothetical protein
MKGKKDKYKKYLKVFIYQTTAAGQAPDGPKSVENFYVPNCIATMMLPLRRTLVLQQFY